MATGSTVNGVPAGSDGFLASHEDQMNKLGTTFTTQAGALTRKNLIFQKRNWKESCCLLSTPIVLCALLAIMQALINVLLTGTEFECGCMCTKYDCSQKPPDCLQTDSNTCGACYSDERQTVWCAIPHPIPWPALLQVPGDKYRAELPGLPANCKSYNSTTAGASGCPVAIPYTGGNLTLAKVLAPLLLETVTPLPPSSEYYLRFASQYPGTAAPTSANTYLETGFLYSPMYFIQPGQQCSEVAAATVAANGVAYPPSIIAQCSGNPAQATCPSSGQSDGGSFRLSSAVCIGGVPLLRNSTAEINAETFVGYRGGNPQSSINELATAYDWRDTSAKKYDVSVYYNITQRNDTQGGVVASLRLSKSLNMATQAFLRWISPGKEVPLLWLKEMPKPGTKLSLDFSSLLGPLFYMWLIQMLFPVILGQVVYEKERNLRTMMKMHGLGDASYWTVMYTWWLFISLLYMIIFVAFGSAIQLKFFLKNDYGIQIVFFFLFCNTQVAFAFLAAACFTSTKTATVSGYLYVFGTGLLGQFLFAYFLEDEGFSKTGIVFMELIPAFALYRGLYELAQYSFIGTYQDSAGMQWSNLSDSQNGMGTAMIILLVEWLIFLPIGYYLDQVVASGSGVHRHWLFCLPWLAKERSDETKLLKKAGTLTSQVSIGMERPDVAEERAAVDALQSGVGGNVIVCKALQKVYPGRDGNPPKFAVRNMSLRVPRGECFGMLGPNGAGKTTSISMMVGFLQPSAGTAYIEGLDIRTQMNRIYSFMGVCPQHDLLWDTLTGREHLLFYGRLKNVKGAALQEAVEASLRSVNLFNGGVGDKQAGRYSGGMKRRLSVAISLIGNPLVVYLDEPSTGLDPASRNNLWGVIKAAKRDRGIILTTHSMEEAEVLCDRLGIFVDGQFQCIGNPKELTSRYGGSYVFTITTPPEFETDVARFVESICPSAHQIYSLAGTQKYEMPTNEVELSTVFQAVEKSKSKLRIEAWGIANTTLEDVFIKISKEAQLGQTLT